MTVLYESIEFIASFIEIFLLYKIYGLLLHKQNTRQSRVADILLSIMEAIIIRTCNHIFVLPYITMLIFILYAVITCRIFYKASYIVIFAIASFYIVCLAGFEFCIFTLISSFYKGQETLMVLISEESIVRMILIIVDKGLWVILYFLMKKYLYRFSLKKNYLHTIFIMSCAGFFGLIYLSNQTFTVFASQTVGMWFVFLVFLILVFIVVYFVIENREEKMKLDFAEVRNELLEEKYNTINGIYTDNAELYHDLNNHLTVLYQLLDEGNNIGAKEYIKEISRPIMKLSKTVWTGIDVVDVIINSKLEIMKEMDIHAEINVEFPQNTNILPNDICTILANLLDNAIEAVGALKYPGSISLVIRRINSFLLIKTSNSCVGSKEKFNQYPETTKKDKKLHGWGLPSVMETIKKYGGTFKCQDEGDKFTVNIMLFFEIVEN